VIEGAYVAGLDVGTTKVCTVISRPAHDGSLCIVGVGLTSSKGLKRGVVVDRQDAIDSIRRSVDEAQRMAGVQVAGAYVGITGDHISSRNVTGRVHTTGGEVSAADVEKVVQSARDSVSLPPDRQIIYSIVRDYAVDGQRGVKRPVGMSGNVLDVELHVVTGMVAIIENLERCVAETGVTVQRRVLEPLATSLAVVTEAERNLGVVLVDIGGGTSDIAAFSNGAICHTSAIPIGGEAVTRDLAQLLRTSTEDAEDLKRKFGYAFPKLVPGDEMVQVRGVGTEVVERVPRRLLAEIIQPRMEEIFQLVKQDLRRAKIHELVTGGMVLSGGGSQLAGTARLASQLLDGIPVRLGSPRNLSGLSDSVSNPMYATGVGLAVMAAQDGVYAMPSSGAGGARALTRLRHWWSQAVVPRLRVYVRGH
jgi:cell division protein FtsA